MYVLELINTESIALLMQKSPASVEYEPSE